MQQATTTDSSGRSRSRIGETGGRGLREDRTRLAIYLRVSTNGQVVDGYGLAAQETECRAYAARIGAEVAAVFSDEGVSGTIEAHRRPGLLAAVSLLQDEAADALLVARLDRLARTLAVQEAMLSEVWIGGADVHAADSGLIPKDDPDDPVRTLVRQIMGMPAQFDRAMIVKRLRDGRRIKAASGGHATGPAPYGWTAKDGELTPVPAEQAALARMLTLRGEGATCATIATALASEVHPTKRGGAWTSPVVSRILARHPADDPTRYITGDAEWIGADRLRQAVTA